MNLQVAFVSIGNEVDPKGLGQIIRQLYARPGSFCVWRGLAPEVMAASSEFVAERLRRISSLETLPSLRARPTRRDLEILFDLQRVLVPRTTMPHQLESIPEFQTRILGLISRVGEFARLFGETQTSTLVVFADSSVVDAMASFMVTADPDTILRPILTIPSNNFLLVPFLGDRCQSPIPVDREMIPLSIRFGQLERRYPALPTDCTFGLRNSKCTCGWCMRELKRLDEELEAYMGCAPIPATPTRFPTSRNPPPLSRKRPSRFLSRSTFNPRERQAQFRSEMDRLP